MERLPNFKEMRKVLKHQRAQRSQRRQELRNRFRAMHYYDGNRRPLPSSVPEIIIDDSDTASNDDDKSDDEASEPAKNLPTINTLESDPDSTTQNMWQFVEYEQSWDQSCHREFRLLFINCNLRQTKDGKLFLGDRPLVDFSLAGLGNYEENRRNPNPPLTSLKLTDSSDDNSSNNDEDASPSIGKNDNVKPAPQGDENDKNAYSSEQSEIPANQVFTIESDDDNDETVSAVQPHQQTPPSPPIIIITPPSDDSKSKGQQHKIGQTIETRDLSADDTRPSHAS